MSIFIEKLERHAEAAYLSVCGTFSVGTACDDFGFY
jgi:hypothetical protein